MLCCMLILYNFISLSNSTAHLNREVTLSILKDQMEAMRFVHL